MLNTELLGFRSWRQKNLSATQRLLICLGAFFLALLSSISTVSADVRDEIVFFFNDALGSAVAAVNEEGELCWSENYTPYGDKSINDDIFSPPGSGCGIVGEERGFTGHTEDVNSDLVYMQQRYYDPSIGRFLSIDPLDANPNDPKTYNRYAYANNNPYKYVDPDGEFAILAYFATPPGIATLSSAANWTAGLMGATMVGAAAYDVMNNQSDGEDKFSEDGNDNSSEPISVDDLSKAGQQPDKNGLTKAGRALQKHGDRERSVFPKSTGSASDRNQQGQEVLDGILSSDKQRLSPNRFGGDDIYDSNTGRGARFDGDGNMKGFLEP